MKQTLLIFLATILIFSCRKESFTTAGDARLYTNTDTLAFDTVFTSAGSVTKVFKIFNDNDQKLRLAQVKLSGGPTSPFKININGTSAPEVNDLEIGANDSIYVFVQVNVNPSSGSMPFILRDSILINYNGNSKFVQLQAYGQNAIFLKNTILKGNETWTSTLPYVILGSLQIDTGATLNISAGTKIFLHADAPFLVDGSLKAIGTNEERITFAGDRLDADYKNLPASWPGIYFRSTSQNNVLKYTIIKNAYQGVIAHDLSTTTNPKLTLSQCIFDNIYDAGILGINTNIDADNCLMSNCGSNIQLQLGGNYRFINCTVASYGNAYVAHKSPVLQLSNSYSDAGVNYTEPMTALFRNCIFWGDGGSVDDEITINKEGAPPFSVIFDHVIYKAKNEIANATFISPIKNEPPLFDTIDVSKNRFDFRFNNDPTSPAVNAGLATSFLYDLDGKPRDAMPDIGCYER